MFSSFHKNINMWKGSALKCPSNSLNFIKEFFFIANRIHLLSTVEKSNRKN